MTQIWTRRRGAIRSCSQKVAPDGSGHHVSGSNAHLFPPLCRPHFSRSLGKTGGGGARCSRGEKLQRDDAKGEPEGRDSLEVGEHDCMASSTTENIFKINWQDQVIHEDKVLRLARWLRRRKGLKLCSSHQILQANPPKNVL